MTAITAITAIPLLAVAWYDKTGQVVNDKKCHCVFYVLVIAIPELAKGRNLLSAARRVSRFYKLPGQAFSKPEKKADFSPASRDWNDNGRVSSRQFERSEERFSFLLPDHDGIV